MKAKSGPPHHLQVPGNRCVRVFAVDKLEPTVQKRLNIPNEPLLVARLVLQLHATSIGSLTSIASFDPQLMKNESMSIGLALEEITNYLWKIAFERILQQVDVLELVWV